MKLLRYGKKGNEQPGILDKDDNIRDLSSEINDIAGEALSAEQLIKINAIDIETLPIVDGNPRIGACVGNVGKFICIGLNYSDHAKESGMEIPSEPVVFFKATSAINGPDDNVEIPKKSSKTDWEVELGIVIGKSTKYITKEQVMSHVAGFCLINDLSEREFQIEREGQWVKGKSCDTFGPIGPYLVTTDEVDFSNLNMWLDVNGTRMQTGSTKNMVYDVPYIVSYLSQFMSLQAGDIISTGTPPGVGLGMNPPKYLSAGDVIELGIDGLGKQRQKCIQA